MRVISDSFIEDLTTGFLSPLLEKVKKDKSLCLEIRNNNNVIVYFSGCKMLELTERKSGGYKVDYCETHYDTLQFDKGQIRLKNKIVRTEHDIKQWIKSFVVFKYVIDEFFNEHYTRSSDYIRQTLIQEYDSSRSSEAKKFVICDQLYENRKLNIPIFKMVGFQCPSISVSNSTSLDCRLAIIEFIPMFDLMATPAKAEKQLSKKIEFFNDTHKVEEMRNEIARILEQKQRLGLIDAKYKVNCSSTQKPMLLYVTSSIRDDNSSLNASFNNLERIGYSGNSAIEIYVAKNVPYDYKLCKDFLMQYQDDVNS